MSTTSNSSLAARTHADARQDAPKFTDTLVQVFARIVARIRAASAERRMRDRLAELPDSLLRDIGIAEHEIPRIRARDRFTPLAWADRTGAKRRYEF